MKKYANEATPDYKLKPEEKIKYWLKRVNTETKFKIFSPK